MKANPKFCKRKLSNVLFLTILGWGLVATAPAMGQDVPSPLSGYATFSEMEKRLEKLAESPHASLRSLGITTGNRNLWLLTISKGETENRPGLAVVGNVVGAHVVGREITLRMAEQIIASAEGSPEIQDLLNRFTLYVIPCPTPDETEKHYKFPVREVSGNESKTDDDRDFSIGEDPPKDLNGDGWITSMRVREEFATHRTHSEDARVLVPIDSKKGEVGEYRILTEGADSDGDEKFGEDASDGVAFNRNFPFNYPYFGKGAGPHQVSEGETRAIADFLYDHPNIGAVICFSPEDNLFHPWKGSAQSDSGKIKSKILSSDQVLKDQIAEEFRNQYPNKDAPESPAGEGSFSEWAYFHYGRWSFASRGWWVPKAADNAPVETEGKEITQNPSDSKADQSGNKPMSKDDKRGSVELNALRWFEQQGIPAFAAWQSHEHANLPSKKVEVGGWKPLFLLNPPQKLVDELVNPHLGLVQAIARKWPKIEWREVSAKRIGPGLVEVKCRIVNTGELPTMPEMADVSGQWFPIQVQLHGVDGVKWLEGSPRQPVGRLKELGGSKEIRWLFLLPNETVDLSALRITASAPTLSPIEQSLKVE